MDQNGPLTDAPKQELENRQQRRDQRQSPKTGYQNTTSDSQCRNFLDRNGKNGSLGAHCV